MDLINIERAILSTFLLSNDLGDDLKNIYKLDLRAFSTPLMKRIADKVNSEAEGNYGYLCYIIEESIKGSAYEEEFLFIIGQGSLTLKYSKRYYDHLLKLKLERLMNGRK